VAKALPRRWTISLVVVLGSWLLALCGCDDDTGDCDCDFTLIAGTEGADIEEVELANAINDYRVRKGLRPISFSARLFVAAHRHARDLAVNQGLLSHVGSDGSTVGQRANDAGYVGLVSENVQASWGCGYGGPNCVIGAWRDSDAHHDNLLSDQYRAMGVGLYGAVAVLVLGSALPEIP
jgi:hypothetical protein